MAWQTPLDDLTMPLEYLLILELAMLGLAAGFLAGMLGVGGGMIMVPFITTILSNRAVPTELAIKMAIATSMSTIVFTSLSSVRAHHRLQSVNWRIVKSIAPGIVMGAAVGSLGVFSILQGATLAFLFAFFVCISATQMLLDKKPPPKRQLPGQVGLIGAGSVIGFFSGLVGAGGGFITVPFLTWCNVSIHTAVATSAGLGFPIAIANAVGFAIGGMRVANLPPYSIGYIWVPALVVIASCSVLTAPLGAATAHRLPVKRLKQIFACVLYMLASYMLYRGATAP